VEHQKVADEIAERSVSLVRDQANLLPLRLSSGQRIAVVIPKPQDLTPADTSSYIVPALASSLREYHQHVDEFILPYAPAESDISALLVQLEDYDLIMIGTLNAYTHTGQSKLVREILKTGIPTIAVALRLPYDLAAFPEAPTYLCTYSILEPSMRALTKAVFGHGEIKGHLPVAIPGLYEAEYHLSR
jgi:beta-N-acetylhexosaminidase